MQAVILLGGLGTRMYPLTYTTPKVLLPLGNRPFLALLLDWLREAGVTDVVFAVSHLKNEIEAAVAAIDTQGLAIRVVPESKPLGSGGAIKNCADILNDDFVLLNGDVLMDVDIADLFRFHLGNRAQVSVTVTRVDDPTHYGIISAGADGRVTEWQEKPPRDLARSDLANVGAWAINKRVLEQISADQFVSLEKETFPALLESAAPFFAYRFSGYWKDIGTPDKYFDANIDLLSGAVAHAVPRGRELAPGVFASASAHIGDRVTLHGPVLIGDGASIADDCTIHGPAAIGDRSSIGARARVAESILWPETRVGPGSTVERCIIAGASVGERCVVRESVVAQACTLTDGVELGAGSVLGPRSKL